MSARVEDIIRRASKTAAQAFLGALSAAQLAGQEITVTLIGAALAAALAAGISAVWNGLVSKP
jgi:hypothetical protein